MRRLDSNVRTKVKLPALLLGTSAVALVLFGIQFRLSTQVTSHKTLQVHDGHGNFNPADLDTRPYKCAINFYGLPRAFQSVVLPSIVENVIIPNAPLGCDYFVHYYQQEKEPSGRSGHGGELHTEEILLLQRQVEDMAEFYGRYPRKPTVLFKSETEDDFWKKHSALVEKVRTAKDSQDRYLYYPWKALTYQHPLTTDNILRMWHSIQESWNLMQQHGQSIGVEYTRVAMLRSDVMYMTPIHLYESSQPGVTTDNNDKQNNKIAVVPGFGRHPVSDRLIYGPAKAVEIWASQRFSRLEEHVQYMLQHNPGWGMHSERFVEHALLPPIRQLGFDIVEHPTLCFFRARADESVWITDCDGEPNVTNPSVTEHMGKTEEAIREKVEALLRRKCGAITKQRRPIVKALDCSSSSTTPSKHQPAQ